MRIGYDPAKRERVLKERGIDLDDARHIFEGRHATVPDDRRDYGEARFITAGFLGRRLAVVVWTPRGTIRRVISMRFCHAKEAKAWAQHLA